MLDCNWLQIKENAVDPHHTNILHVIPQMRGMQHFADEFGNFPELTWADTPAGVIYLGVRRVGDNVWVRSAETFGVQHPSDQLDLRERPRGEAGEPAVHDVLDAAGR